CGLALAPARGSHRPSASSTTANSVGSSTPPGWVWSALTASARTSSGTSPPSGTIGNNSSRSSPSLGPVAAAGSRTNPAGRVGAEGVPGAARGGVPEADEPPVRGGRCPFGEAEDPSHHDHLGIGVQSAPGVVLGDGRDRVALLRDPDGQVLGDVTAAEGHGVHCARGTAARGFARPGCQGWKFTTDSTVSASCGLLSSRYRSTRAKRRVTPSG